MIKNDIIKLVARSILETLEIIQWLILKLISMALPLFIWNKAKAAQLSIRMGNWMFKNPFCQDMYKDYEHYLKHYPASFAGFDSICDISQEVKDKSVIEIGSGLGHYSQELYKFGAKEVIGVEIQVHKTEFARDHNKHPKEISFINGDATQLNFNENSFDFAFSHTVFEHISNVPKALTEIEKVLKPGGKVLLSFNYIHHQGGHHLFPYIHFPWPTWIVKEKHLCEFWTKSLVADQKKGYGFYYEEGAKLTHLGHGSEFNLNRMTFDQFENEVTNSNFEIEKQLSSHALGLLFPFLRKMPKLKYPMTGTVFYLLKNNKANN